MDQIDTLLARSLAHTDEADDFGDGVLEQVAHGLMAVRQTMGVRRGGGLPAGTSVRSIAAAADGTVYVTDMDDNKLYAVTL